VNRVELHSPIPPERCADVLRAAIVNDWKWEGLGSGKRVAGSVNGTSVKLRKRTLYNNSFRTYLYASLAPEGSGSRVSVRSGVHPMAIVFMTIWFGVSLTPFAVELLSPRGTLPLAVLAMPLMGVAFVTVGRLFSYGDRAYLLDFLATTLRAAPVAAPRRN